MKTSRRIISVLLALTMVFSLGALNFSFAADEVEYCVKADCVGVCEWRYESTYGCEETWGLYCKVCDNRKMGETIYNHQYEEYARTEPTCMKSGLAYFACEKDDCYSTTTQVLPIVTNAHSFGEWEIVTPATCNKLGSKQRVCYNTDGNSAVCGHIETEIIPYDEAAHVFEGEWITRITPTCDAEGEAYRICSVCKTKEETKVLPAHSATWHEYDRVEATCTKEGTSYVVCTECNTNGTVVIPTNDDHAWLLKEVSQEATCTEDGAELWVCRWHNDVTKTEVIEAEGHSFTNYVSNNDAKCGVDGTKTAKCDNCDAESTVTDEGSALTHTESKWLVISGDCSKGEAVTAYKNCVYCKKEMVSEKTFPAGTHPNRQLVTVAATCLTDGYTGNICTDCGDGEKTVIPAGHVLPDEWTTVKESTCADEGLQVKECANCDYYETNAIEKKTHIFIVFEKGVEATCLKDGYTDLLYCMKCSYTIPSEVVSATGHNDANNDGCCDKCYVYFVETENGIVDCDCFCHNQDGLAQFIFKIYNFICQIFGMNQTCVCGKVHYEGNGLFGGPSK